MLDELIEIDLLVPSRNKRMDGGDFGI